jgi:hypothetical protein
VIKTYKQKTCIVQGRLALCIYERGKTRTGRNNKHPRSPKASFTTQMRIADPEKGGGSPQMNAFEKQNIVLRIRGKPNSSGWAGLGKEAGE